MQLSGDQGSGSGRCLQDDLDEVAEASMAFDEGLAQRIREALAAERGVSEKRMFGGIAFLLNGNMAVGVVKDDLMVRVGPDAYETLLADPNVRPMDFTGRPMRGFVYVASEGLVADADLHRWIGHGAAYARALPAKQG
jgi:TfoX/Sxy family transcriptional regulator of competence genes